MKVKISLSIIVLTLIELSFSTKAQTVTDIDGNVYNTVTIGTQVWMKENLKVTKYLNGDSIGTTTSWVYDGADSNLTTYGRLYTWFTVTDSRKVCPIGWHVPTDDEWITLTTDYLVNDMVAGGKMKETGTNHWSSPNDYASNSCGFTALPGGRHNPTGTFSNLGINGYWWSSSEVWYDKIYAWYRKLVYNSGNAFPLKDYKSYGFSVRCLSDAGVTDIHENKDNPQFKLYPNPSDSKFKILITNISTDKTIIEICNLMGQIVLKQKNKTEIDLSNSPKGIYFVKFYDGEKIYTEKIVIE